MGPEAEHNWLNVSGLESGSEYEFRIVAMNNGANKTVSEPTIIYVGERKGLCQSFSTLLLLQSVPLLYHTSAVTKTPVFIVIAYFKIGIQMFVFQQLPLSRDLHPPAGSLCYSVLLHSFFYFYFSSALSGATVVANMPVSFPVILSVDVSQ